MVRFLTDGMTLWTGLNVRSRINLVQSFDPLISNIMIVRIAFDGNEAVKSGYLVFLAWKSLV